MGYSRSSSGCRETGLTTFHHLLVSRTVADMSFLLGDFPRLLVFLALGRLACSTICRSECGLQHAAPDHSLLQLRATRRDENAIHAEEASDPKEYTLMLSIRNASESDGASSNITKKIEEVLPEDGRYVNGKSMNADWMNEYPPPRPDDAAGAEVASTPAPTPASNITVAETLREGVNALEDWDRNRHVLWRILVALLLVCCCFCGGGFYCFKRSGQRSPAASSSSSQRS